MSATKSPSRRHHKLRLTVLSLVGIVVLAAAGASVMLGPEIRRKLTSAVASRMDASLTIGTVFYLPPFTVECFDVRFVAHPHRADGGTELMSARRIKLSLAKLPLGKGPLVIQQFKIVGPVLRATRGADGNFAGLDLVRSTSQPSTASQVKLSDVLRLRHFSISDGSIIYQNLASSGASNGAPTEWKGLSSDITLAPRSASLYEYKFSAADLPIAHATIDGTIDVDSLLLKITKLSATVQSPDRSLTAGANPLPAELKELVQKYGIEGTIGVSTTGTIPLLDPNNTSLAAELTINGGRATLPDSGQTLNDFSLTTHIERDPSRAIDEQWRIDLTSLRAVSGGGILQLKVPLALVDPSSGKWSINEISGSLDAPAENHGPWGMTGHADLHADISHDPVAARTPFVGTVNMIGIRVQPPGFATPLEGLTGTIQAVGNDAKGSDLFLHDLSARYGGDQLMLDGAQVSLKQFPQRVQVNGIQSRFNLVQNAPRCPGDLGPIIEAFQPSGWFALSGTAGTEHVIRPDGPGYSPDWDVVLSTEQGNVTLLDERIPVTGLSGRMLVTKHAVSIPGLKGNLLGGAIDLVGNARVVDPVVYEGEVNEQGASVSQFADAFKIKSPDGSQPSGVGNVRFKFFSQPSAASTKVSTTQPLSDAEQWLAMLAGDGSLQLDNGNLWALPALQSLSKHTRVAREALTAGEAAAIFTVANQIIHFKHLAVYSPALGLQGSGTESFDGMLNLDIIAAPLGDWKRKLAETDIPFFSSLLASAAGSIEKLVGSATSELLYHFRVTGTREDPVVQTVPAPFITDSAASLFARMIRHDGNTKLVDAVNEK